MKGFWVVSGVQGVQVFQGFKVFKGGGSGGMLACAAARAFASSFLDRRRHPGVDDDMPTEPDVLGDFCRAPVAVV